METKICKRHPRYKTTKKPRTKCGNCWSHYLSKNGFVATSDDFDLETTQAIEDVSDISIELDGSVNLTFAKDGVVIMRDELDKKVILQLIISFIEDSIKNLANVVEDDVKKSGAEINEG